jgi:SAM-dependent methyltransferase
MDIAVSVVDILPLNSTTPGLTFIQEDATLLSHFENGSIASLSSLNAGEHFGLGRYSDRVDPLAHLTFMSSLARALAPGGRLYFSVPIGRERLRFNSHRVLSTSTVLKGFPSLSLCSFSYVDDDGEMHEDVDLSEAPADMHCGCGLFEFTK